MVMKRVEMKTLQLLLPIAVYTSLILGLQILLMDKWLWNAAPSHALGLVLFVVVDGLLLLAMWDKIRFATLGTVLVSFAQLAAMIGDIVNGQPTGVPTDSFRSYLLADTIFISLLVVQGIILSLATIAFAAPFFSSEHRLSLFKIRKH